MHRWWILSLLALLSASAYYAHADLPPKRGPGIFASKPEPKAPEPKTKSAPKPDAPEEPKVITPEESERLYRLEQEAYIRRMAVISKIREVATLKNDQITLAKISQLEQEAEELFTQRTAHLPTVSAARLFSKAAAEGTASVAPSKSLSSPIPQQPRRLPALPSEEELFPSESPTPAKLPSLEKSR
jgi:hypothetical protein